MVGGDDERPRALEVLEAVDADLHRGQLGELAGGAAGDPPPPGQLRQQRHAGRHRQGGEADDQPEAAGVEHLAGGPGRALELRPGARQGQPRHLPPDRPAAAQPAALVELAAGGAADLAARGLGHRVRRHQRDVVGRRADEIDGHGLDLLRELRPGFLADLAGLRQDDELLGGRDGVGAAEDRHAALAHARQVADRLLQLLRVDVAAGADDHVLGAAGDEDLALGDVGHVARVEPVAVEQLPGGLRVAVVAAGGGGPAELQAALLALAELGAGGVDDADLVARQRVAAADEAQRGLVVRRRRLGAAGARQAVAVDGVDPRLPPPGREGQRQRVLGQPVDRHHRAGLEAVGREALGEAADGLGADRLGAVECRPPGGQVEALDLVVVDLLQAQLVGEVGRRRQGAAVVVDRLEPARRAGQEGERRHQHQLHGEVERAHPGADQAHVVVERQPADHPVARAQLDRLADGAQVGQQVGVGEDHPLGVGGAAGGELQEGDVLLLDGRQPCGAAGAAQVGDGHHPLQGRDLGLDQPRQGQHLGDRHQHPRLRRVEDAGLAAQVVLELAGAHRRVERHRRGAGDLDAEEGGEVVEPAGQHQAGALARLEADRFEAGGGGAGALEQAGVGQLFDDALAGQEGDVAALRVALGVPLEDLHESPRGVRHRLVFALQRSGRLRAGGARRRSRRRRLAGALHRAQQVARRLGRGHQALGQADAERLLQPRDQLGPAQAVEPEVLVERAVEPEAAQLAPGM